MSPVSRSRGPGRRCRWRRLGPCVSGADRNLALPLGRTLDLAIALESGLLRTLKVPAVPHGFRSTFRDWAAEETNHPREVVEAALAYVVQNKVEAVYARSDLFERRRRLMDDWSAYVAGSAGNAGR